MSENSDDCEYDRVVEGNTRERPAIIDATKRPEMSAFPPKGVAESYVPEVGAHESLTL